MDDWRVYIANIGKYNDGELVGAWFTFPLDEEEIRETIGLDKEYEEYAIHDYELPFSIGEYISIDSLNEMYEMCDDMDFSDEVLKELFDVYGSIEEIYEHADDIVCYSECDDMEDVAYYLINDEQVFGNIPEEILNYFDYKAFGYDLGLEDTFIFADDCAYRCLW